MASLEIRRNKTGLSYRVIWNQNGQRQSETHNDKFIAERFKIDVEECGNQWPPLWVRGDGYGRPKPEAEVMGQVAVDQTLTTWMISWIDSDQCTAAPETRVRYKRHVRDHVTKRGIGTVPISRVDRSMMLAWLAELAEAGLAHKTIKNLRAEVSTTLTAAVIAGKLPSNPLEGCKVPAIADPEDARRPVFLTRAEYTEILAGVRADHKVLIETLAGSGIRWGEARALKVRALDLDGVEPVIEIFVARKHSAAGGHRIGNTKTRSGKRTVAISTRLAGMLAEHIVGKGSQDLVFNNIGADGTWWRNIWHPAVLAAGFTDPATAPRVHDLRHSHASWLLKAGRPLFAVSKRLGHANLSITADLYGHMDRSGGDGMAATLNAM